MPTYLPQLVIVLIKRAEGQWRACYSVSFPGNWRANLTSIPPVTRNLPFPPRVKTAAASCLPSATQWGVPPGPCFRRVSFPQPLNHWCLCHWLGARSLVLKLGRHRPCGPAGCSPTIGGAARRLRKLPWAPPRCREIRTGNEKLQGWFRGVCPLTSGAPKLQA